MKKLIRFIVTLAIIAAITLMAVKYIYKTEYLSIINMECEQYGLKPVEILSIIKAESDFRSDAVSAKNAIGLMQITLETANWCAAKMGISELTESDLYVPEINIKIGTYYYDYLLKRYGSMDTAIAAYNGGMGNVDKWLLDSQYCDDGVNIKHTPYRETTRYITKINNNIKIYKLLYKEL